jgi:hypothetical protein
MKEGGYTRRSHFKENLDSIGEQAAALWKEKFR